MKCRVWYNILYNDMLYIHMLYIDTLYNEMLFNNMLYNEMLYIDMLHNDMLYIVMLYNKRTCLVSTIPTHTECRTLWVGNLQNSHMSWDTFSGWDRSVNDQSFTRPDQPPYCFWGDFKCGNKFICDKWLNINISVVADVLCWSINKNNFKYQKTLISSYIFNIMIVLWHKIYISGVIY